MMSGARRAAGGRAGRGAAVNSERRAAGRAGGDTPPSARTEPSSAAEPGPCCSAAGSGLGGRRPREGPGERLPWRGRGETPSKLSSGCGPGVAAAAGSVPEPVPARELVPSAGSIGSPS